MSDFSGFAWDDVKTSSYVDSEGYFTFAVKEATLGKSRAQVDKKEKKMATMVYEVIDPPQFAGLLQSDRFTFGSEEDPDCTLDATLKASIGTKNLKRLIDAGNITGIKGGIEAALKAVQGIRFIGKVVKKAGYDKQGNTLDNFNVKGYYPVNKAPATNSVARPAPAAPPVKVESKMLCGECNEAVVASQYLGHIRSHGEVESGCDE